MNKLRYEILDGNSRVAVFENLDQAILYMEAFCEKYYNDAFDLHIKPLIEE